MKPYLEDKHDLVNDSEKFEVKICMLLRYFVLLLIPVFFFKIYPY